MEHIQRELGSIVERLHHLESQCTHITSEVEAIKEQVTAVRGGWKVLLLIAGAAATIGGFMTRMFGAL